MTSFLPRAALAIALAMLGACSGGGGGDGGSGASPPAAIVVNSLLDSATPPAGTVTLRSALAAAASGQVIEFDGALNGGTIALSIVADEHTRLKGEVMGIRNEPSGPVSYLVGYFDRDYGRSALVARKDVVIDASDLPAGITLTWAGTTPARVLAVSGDLTLDNVTITGGHSVAENISATNPNQPWTLARGGAVAVWGVARLSDCRLHGNRVEGDFESSRDRGAFGGAVYADIVLMERCVVSGNSVLGGGAAGGGVYSVGGAEDSRSLSSIDRSTVSGNAIRGLFAYGAGVYSDGGGIGNSKTLRVTNTTIARNLAEPAPGLPPSLLAMGYWRGGGLYLSNGYLELQGATIVENLVRGVPRTDSLGRRNLAGGIAATVGNAHAVERMIVGHSIVTGNTVEEIGGASYPHDLFTGSLMHFESAGYNRFGMPDFSQILVPVGVWTWESLSRRHYPKVDDADGVALASVVDLVGGITVEPTIPSVGVDAGNPVVLHYRPTGSALDRIPAAGYRVTEIIAEYEKAAGAEDDFLEIVLGRIERRYGLTGFAAAFEADFEGFLRSVDADAQTDGIQPYRDPSGQPILTLADTHFFGPAQTWPRELENHPYIHFWHRLDTALAEADLPGMGPELLGDSTWQRLFSSGTLTENPGIRISVRAEQNLAVQRLNVDQLGTARPSTGESDIGAIELR
jgi:hypothetical protein